MFNPLSRRKRSKEKLAVALQYDPKRDDDAPEIVASEKGYRAEALLELAKIKNVPVHKDPDLAELLSAAKIGDSIPPIAFLAVAEILKSLYDRLGISAPQAENNEE